MRHFERLLAPASDFDPVYTGHDGIRAFWRTWFVAWETTSFECKEFIDAGDTVITVLTQRVRGRASGLELESTSFAQTWAIQDANVVRVEFFPTRSEALEAAGLRE